METSQDWKKWVDALRSSIEDRDRVVLGVDGKKAVPEDGEESAVDDDWSLKTEWKEDEGKLVQYLVALKDGELEGKKIGKGEKIEVAHEYRFDEAGRDRMFRESKLQSFQEFMSEDGSYGEYGEEAHVISLHANDHLQSSSYCHHYEMHEKELYDYVSVTDGDTSKSRYASRISPSEQHSPL